MTHRRLKPDGHHRTPTARRTAAWGTLAASAFLATAALWNSPAVRSGQLASQPATGDRLARELPTLPVAQVAEGTWSVAGMDWDLRVQHAAADQLAQRLAQPPVVGTTAGREGPEQEEFLAVLKSRLPELARDGGGVTYGCDLPAFKLRAFVREAPTGAVLLGGYAAYPRGTGDWALVTATPRAGADGGLAAQRKLLPLPAGSQRLAMRTGEDGRLQCDVVWAGAPLDALHAAWQASGWCLERPAGSPDQPGGLFCVRGEELIRVTVLRQAANGTLLILTALSAATIPAN